MSATRRVIGPTVSSDHASGMPPWREQRPYVGLRPATAHTAAGTRIEAPVSPPRAAGSIRAASAAAEPPELPPGERSRSQGLRVGEPPVP